MGNIRHKLSDALLLIIMARLCKKESRSAIIEFGKHNLDLFQSMGMLEKGVPSEPTLCRIEHGVDNETMAFQMAVFTSKFAIMETDKTIDIVAIDGKCLCGTEQSDGRHPDVVSAYSVGTNQTLATEMCDEKSNEIRAVPILLDKLNIARAIITADAMSCQKDIIDRIRKKDYDFLIEVKANQKTLLWGIEDRLASAPQLDVYQQEPTLDHGRIEWRTCTTYDGCDVVVDMSKWGYGLTVVVVDTHSIKKSTDKETSERRIYITNLRKSAEKLNNISRSHWRIETFHWHLDYNFRQDRVRRNSMRAARNTDTLMRMCLSVISAYQSKHNPSERTKNNRQSLRCAKLMDKMSNGFFELMRVVRLK